MESLSHVRSRRPPGPARLLAAAAAALLLAFPAGAVIIDSDDGTGNTGAPPDDPGWAHVGIRGGWTAIYLRNRWLLTANHVATGPVELGGVLYDDIPGSAIRLDNGDGTFADLKVFAIAQDPGLPELPIRANTNLPKGEVIMIGMGLDRGAATDSDDPAVWVPLPGEEPPDPPIPGWYRTSPKSLRWGKNTVGGEWPGDPSDTVTFFTDFSYPADPSHTAHEAQAASGDSGGAVFAKQGSTWELAGLMFIIGLYDEHVNNSVLRGEWTGAADLSFYRDDIMSLTAVPEPGGSLLLGAGLAFLATVGRRRMRP
jgi:hypothetical protein